MNEPEHSLEELRSGVAAALERAEERMSHVQRQLAGWGPLCLERRADESSAGWKALESQADAIAEDVDANLVKVQQELGGFLQQARELAAALNAQS